MIRCAVSTCGLTGKLTKRGRRRRRRAGKPKRAWSKPKPACGKNRRRARRWKPRSGNCGNAGAEATREKSPHAPHSGPDDGPFRPSLPHRFEVRSTLLLGVEILRWEACRDHRSVQQRRRSKVYI